MATRILLGWLAATLASACAGAREPASLLREAGATTDDAGARATDGSGDGGRDGAQPAAALDASIVLGTPDCAPDDPQVDPGFYERFADGLDSDCDGQDDPAVHHEPCTCDWVARPPHAALELDTVCGDGFDPSAAVPVVREAELGSPSCDGLPDLALSFVVQCRSECFGVPLYVAVANVGGARAPRAELVLEGSFRQRPPRTPLSIEPLAPGERTALIEVLATGGYELALRTGFEQCETRNDRVPIDAYDHHCGFLP